MLHVLLPAFEIASFVPKSYHGQVNSCTQKTNTESNFTQKCSSQEASHQVHKIDC